MTSPISPNPVSPNPLPIPDPTDKPSFTARKLSILTWLVEVFYPGFIEMANRTYTNAVAAFEASGEATLSAAGVSAPQWTAGTYAVGVPRFDIATGHTYRCILAGPSTVNPANDPTRWRLFADDLTDVEVTTTTHTAAHRTRVIIKTAGAACNVTMPALVNGARIGIKVANGRRDNIVTFGVSPHEDSTDTTMKLDARFKSFEIKGTATKWEING